MINLQKKIKYVTQVWDICNYYLHKVMCVFIKLFTCCNRYRLNEPVFGRSPIFGINLVLDYSSGEDIKVGDPVFALSKD